MLVFWIILVLALIYALPGLIAAARRHPRQRQIWLLDIGLGFTIFGWVMALGQAIKMPQETRRVRYSYAEDGLDRRPRRSLSELPINSDLFLAIGCIAIIALLLSLAWQRVSPAIMAQFGATQASAASHGWTYASDTVQSSRFARIDSDANSPARATLTIRGAGHDVDAALTISGQFNCSAASNGTVVVQFDQQQAQFVHCAPRPANAGIAQGGQDNLYIADPQTFVAGLATAHTVSIQAEIAGQGLKTMTFSPQGLDLAALDAPATDGQTAAVVPAAIQVTANQAPAVKIAQSETTPVIAAAPAKAAVAAPVIKTTAVKISRPHKDYVVRKPEPEPARYRSWHE